ncbi:MAG: Crp/Fnr family transcriptional regulator [Ectothiorhodospiraceae bacterium]|nr:Crp/Fnr family transcriptional regulator [Ectothiorhodospiraceae bacterium]MCH8503239.1 Crp/Fnr family transcriptional regulator [Ectothiorhodospiraceae bacterium]
MNSQSTGTIWTQGIMDKSCIVRHFRTYAELDAHEEELLDSLEKSPQAFRRGGVIWEEGDEATDFYTIRRGWLFSYRYMEDGSRQVLDIFVPGDIAGLREFAFSGRLTGLATLTDVEICAFPKTRMTEVFGESLLLSNLFFAVAAREQAVLLERLVNLGRRTALQKVAHFVLEMYTRLQRTNNFPDNHFRLPLPQHVLGDALGLSAVHVSRTFGELKEAELLCRDGGHISILDVDRLAQVAGFKSTYLREDLSSVLRALENRAVLPPGSTG